jgi:hypothetical protein
MKISQAKKKEKDLAIKNIAAAFSLAKEVPYAKTWGTLRNYSGIEKEFGFCGDNADLLSMYNFLKPNLSPKYGVDLNGDGRSDGWDQLIESGTCLKSCINGAQYFKIVNTTAQYQGIGLRTAKIDFLVGDRADFEFTYRNFSIISGTATMQLNVAYYTSGDSLIKMDYISIASSTTLAETVFKTSVIMPLTCAKITFEPRMQDNAVGGGSVIEATFVDCKCYRSLILKADPFFTTDSNANGVCDTNIVNYQGNTVTPTMLSNEQRFNVTNVVSTNGMELQTNNWWMQCTPNQTYIVSIEGKTDTSATSQIGMFVSFFNNSGTYLSSALSSNFTGGNISGSSSNSNTLVKITGTIVVPELATRMMVAGSFKMNVLGACNVNFVFRNFFIHENTVSGLVPRITDQKNKRENLVHSLTDRDLNGVSDGWGGYFSNLSYDGDLTLSMEDGTQKIYTTNTGGGVSNYEFTCAINNFLPNETITARVTGKNSGDSRVQLTVLFFNGASFISANNTTVADYASFTSMSLTAVAPANTTKCYIAIKNYMNANNGAGTVWYKDVYAYKDTDIIQTTVGYMPKLCFTSDILGIFYDGVDDFLQSADNPNLKVTSEMSMLTSFKASSAVNGTGMAGYVGSSDGDYKYMSYLTTNSTGISGYCKATSGASFANMAPINYNDGKFKTLVQSFNKAQPIDIVNNLLSNSQVGIDGDELASTSLGIDGNDLSNIPLGTSSDGLTSTGWVHTSNAGITATPLIEEAAQKVLLTASSSVDRSAISISGRKPCVAGDTITISALGKILNLVGSLKIRIEIDWATAVSGGYLTSSYGAWITSASEFANLTVTGVVPATATYHSAILAIYPNAIGNTGNVWFKNAILNNGISDGWTFAENGVTTVSKNINDSAQRIAIANANVNNATVTLTKTVINVRVGDIVTFTLKYKTNNCYFRYAIQELPSNGTLIAASNYTSDGVYTTVTHTLPIVTAGTTAVNVIVGARAINIGDTGEVWVKDTVVSNGISLGWVSYQLNPTTFSIDNGAQKIQLTSNLGNGTSSRIYGNAVTSNIYAGQKFTLSGYYKNDTVNASLEIDFLDSAGTVLNSPSIITNNTPNADYVFATISGTAPANTVVVQAVCKCLPISQSAGSAWFKDLTMYKSARPKILFEGKEGNSFAEYNEDILTTGTRFLTGSKVFGGYFCGYINSAIVYNKDVQNKLKLYMNQKKRWNPSFNNVYQSQVVSDTTSTWMTVKTDNTGTSASNQFTLPLENGGVYSFTVDWGDGTTSSTITIYNDSQITHTFANGAGTYDIKITGTIRGWRFNNGGDCKKLTEIKRWGVGFRLGNNNGYFYGCSNMVASYTDVLDMTGTTTMFNAFYGCSLFNGLMNMNTASVTNMSAMLQGCAAFNQSVASMNMASVSTIREMFYGCSIFNQSVSGWVLTSCTNYTNMFFGCSAFNQPLVPFDGSNVTSYQNILMNCTNWLQDVSGWSFAGITGANANAFSGAFTGTKLANYASGDQITCRAYYNALLTSINARSTSTGTLLSIGSCKYSAGTPNGLTAKNALLARSTPWTFTDGGLYVITVTNISPSSGTTAGGTSVTITGTNFTGATSVTIGGVPVTGFTVVSNTSITATTPAGTAGAKDVVVTTPDGSGTGTNLYTYV